MGNATVAPLEMKYVDINLKSAGGLVLEYGT